MQCNRCRALLPVGAAICPYCANPTPYNAGSSPANAYPPPPPPTSYGQPAYLPPPHVPYGQPMMVPVAVAPRKQSGCGIAAIIVSVILFIMLCGGALLFGSMYISKQNATATVTSINNDATSTAYATELTPTPYPPYTESISPSGATFSEAAQQVIPSAQLAGSVDSEYRPTTLQSTFRSGQTIYLSYKWAQGNTGYVMTRWYVDGTMKVQIMSKYIGYTSAGYGYMSDDFYAYDRTSQGTIEVFWCQDSGCKHGGLAWARPFSITAS